MKLLKQYDATIRDRARDIASGAAEFARRGRTPRTGAKRTVTHYIGQLPRYLRLLAGLVADSRVSILDKVLVGAAIAYIVAPVDFLPDFVPFLGQVDDVYLLTLSLQRLIKNAGRRVVLDHWSGNPSDLGLGNLQRVLSAAAFFLPGRMQRRLRRVAKR